MPTLLPCIVMAGACAACFAEPDMQLNSCVAVVSQDISRWSEGGFLVLNDRDVFLAVTGYTQYNHDSSPANIYGFWSHDGGITWTPQEKAILLQDAEGLGMHNIMSVGLVKLASGDVLMTFYGYKRYRRLHGTFVMRSCDGAKTWSRARFISEGSVSMPGRSFQLPSGRVIVPIRGGVLYSDDDGKTWDRGLCPADRHREATVVPLEDGRLLLFMRNTSGQIVRSYSRDDGGTWGPMMPTGIPSPCSMCTLTRLQNGDIMVIFNMVRDRSAIDGAWPRHRLCTMISRDEGQSWGHLRFLDGGDHFEEVLKITMATATTIGEDGAIVAWSRSPKQSKEHYRNLYDYRIRKFNLEWLYAGDDPTHYTPPK
jgi:photosystem II stability/assembly factor-like uncharacterized protein